MHNGKYKSIKDMMSRLLRNPLLSDLNESDVASYIADAIRFIEAPMAYEDKNAEITIQDYRGELPCDIIYILQTQQLLESSSTDANGATTSIVVGALPMRYATDHFHTSLHMVSSPDLQKDTFSTGLTYKLQADHIFTSFREGKVRMAYKGLMLDDQGYPMIPDHVKVEKAIENHIMYEHLRILWMLGKVADKVYRDVQVERDWYIGAANTGLQLQTIDQAEAMKAALTRTILKPLQHDTGFQNLGSQEYIKKGSI